MLLDICNVQIDLICQENGRGDGVKITPHIGYNCHDAIMAEMAHIVEACNGGGGGSGSGGGGQY